MKKFNMRSLVAILFLTLTPHRAFAQPEWVPVISTERRDYEFKLGSFSESQTKGGIRIVMAIGRGVSKVDDNVDFIRSYVPIEHCRRKMGRIVTLNIDGTFRFESDFVFDGGNVASAIAEFLCETYEIRLRNIEKKGV